MGIESVLNLCRWIFEVEIRKRGEKEITGESQKTQPPSKKICYNSVKMTAQIYRHNIFFYILTITPNNLRAFKVEWNAVSFVLIQWCPETMKNTKRKNQTI